MHSDYAESHSSDDFGEQHSQQHTIFQKYSHISSNNQHSHNILHHSQPNHNHFPEIDQITPIVQTKVVDSNIQAVSDDDDHREKSIIESVPKDDSSHDLHFISHQNHDLSNVPQASSKIIHQPVSRHELNQYVQPYQHSNPQPHVNTSAQMHPHRVMNQSANYQHSIQQQNNMRHTIGSNQSPRQVMVSGQQNMMRGSLPANVLPQQLIMRQGNVQHNFGQVQQMPQQQVLSHQQFATMPQSPQLRQGQLIPQQNTIMKTTYPNFQQARVPHHMPQSLVPVKNIRSQTLVQAVNFIQNGQQRLQTSEIVYKNRNPALMSKNQSQMHIQQQNGVVAHYQQQPNVQVVERNGSQGRENSGEIRANTRSLERRQTNVVFNYNVGPVGVQTQNRVNQQNIQQVPHQGVRSASLSPVPISTMPPSLIPKQQLQPPVAQPVVQKVAQPAAQSPSVSHKVQAKSTQQIQVKNQWKERYFGLFERLQTVNKKVEYISESVYIYEKLIEVSKQQKIVKKHSKIMNSIQELQQECVSIVHEWRPTSEFKLNDTVSKDRSLSNNTHKDSKDVAHLEMKYKRLLFNYSKVQQENQVFKKTFEEKIHQVVKKLQAQNSSLTNTINKLQAQNKRLESASNQLSIQVSSLKQRVSQSPERIEQSDDLRLSESLKLQLEGSVARYHQQNRFLQGEMERLNEEVEGERKRNHQLMEALHMLEQQVMSQEQANEREGGGRRIGVENIEDIIEELNKKIMQYQFKLSTVEDQTERLNYMNQQAQMRNEHLQHELIQMQRREASCSQNTNMNGNKVQELAHELSLKQQQLQSTVAELQNVEHNNFMLTQMLQTLTLKMQNLENDIKHLNTQDHPNQNQNQAQATSPNPNHLQRLQVQRLQVQNSKLHQQIVSLRDQLQRLNDKFKTTSQQMQRTNQYVENASDLNLITKNMQIANELQTAYARVNQLQQELDQSQINLADYNIKISNFQEQIRHYQQQLSHLQQTISQLTRLQQTISQQPNPKQLPTTSEPSTNPSAILIQQYEFTIATLRSQVNRKESQIQRESRLSDQRILDLTEQLKLAYKQRENLHKKYQEKTLLLQTERQKKQILIRQLRDKLYELQQKRRIENADQSRSKQYISKLSSINETKQLTKLTHELQTLKSQNAKLLKDHQLQTKTHEDQIHQLAQDNSRLKKQISDFTHTINELEQMSEALSKKNMEILDLKNIAFLNQTLLIDIANLKKQLERQLQQNARVQTQNDRLQKNLIDLNRNLKQLENTLLSTNSKLSTIQSDYKQAQQSVNSKDLQLNKTRIGIQSLEQEISSMQKEESRLNNKLRNLEIAHEQQSAAFKEQQQANRSKQTQVDQLSREKSISEHKLTQLESYKQKYEYQLKQNEQAITKLKSKLKLLESQKQDLAQELQSFREKSAQVEKKAAEQAKKYKKAVDDLQDKNKHLQEKQHKFEKQKIHELETDLKTKQNKIWKLQKELQELLERLDEVGDQELNGQKVLLLQQKVKQYEARIFTQAFKYTPSSYDHEATKVFEQRVIYELKQENERLRQFINEKRAVKPTTDKAGLSGSNLGLSRAEVQIKEAYDEELDEVQGRLTAFNQKLESLINNGTYDNTAAENMRKTRKSASKLSAVNTASHRPVQAFQGQTNQVRELRAKYKQLQRYCKNIEVELLSSNSQKTITSNNIVTVSSHSIAHNEVTFLKEKNKELDERVYKLLKMNTQLKENMEHLLQQRNDHSTLNYFKEQIAELSQKNLLLEQRVKKLLEENERAKGQLGSFSKSEESGQVKVFELERKVLEMQRTINELLHAKASMQSEIQSKNQQLQARQYEIKELRSQLAVSGEKQSSVVSGLRQQLQNSETDMVKLSNKLRVHQSQIQRLNQMLRKKQSEWAEETNRWRLKVSQLQEELNKAGQEKEGEKASQSSLKIDMSRLGQEVKALNFYNQELKQTNQTIIKKLQDSESRLRELHSQYEELQNALSAQRLEEQQWAIKFDQQEANAAKLNNQVLVLRQEIERLNEDAQLKQRNHQIQIHALHQKLALNERQLLNLRKNTSLFESDKQLLDNELLRLKNHIAQLLQQLQDQDQTHRNRQLMYEDKITTLKTQITQIESHSTSSQHAVSDLHIHNQRLESQLLELKNQITILKSEIERLNSVIKEKDSTNSSLQLTISSLNEQISKCESQIIRLVTQSNILKDEIDRLKFVIVEKDSGVLSLRSQNEALSLERDNMDRQLVQTLMQLKGFRQENERLLSQIQQLQSTSSSQMTNLSGEVYRLRKENEESKIIIKTLQIERENDQREIASWIGQFNLLKQENFQLVNKISQLEATYLAAMKISPAEFEALREQNLHLRQNLRVLNEKLALIERDVGSLKYLVELERSIWQEIESLLDHKQVSSAEEQTEINYRTSQEIGKGFDVLAQIRLKLHQLL